MLLCPSMPVMSSKWKKIILTRLREHHRKGVIKPVGAEERWSIIEPLDKSWPVAY